MYTILKKKKKTQMYPLIWNRGSIIYYILLYELKNKIIITSVFYLFMYMTKTDECI